MGLHGLRPARLGQGILSSCSKEALAIGTDVNLAGSVLLGRACGSRLQVRVAAIFLGYHCHKPSKHYMWEWCGSFMEDSLHLHTTHQ